MYLQMQLVTWIQIFRPQIQCPPHCRVLSGLFAARDPPNRSPGCLCAFPQEVALMLGEQDNAAGTAKDQG